MISFETDWHGAYAGFSSRQDGVSGPPYDTLNLGLHVGDEHQHVIFNRQRWSENLHCPMSTWVIGEQVHGGKIARVKPKDMGRGVYTLTSAVAGVDGLVTNDGDVALVGLFADCYPIYVYDPVKRAIGLAHAGWRGTALRVASLLVQRMQEEFASVPGDLLAAIGPGIGPECYRVDHGVMDPMRTAYENADSFYQADGGIDLAGLNHVALLQSGVLPQNITLARLCTSCRDDLFFSYRRDQGKTGRMAAIIRLQNLSGIPTQS